MDGSETLAVIVGASGGIGRALMHALARTGRYDHLIGIGRTRPADWPIDPGWRFIVADVTREDQLADAAAIVAGLAAPTRVVVATGLLHGPGVQPEKSMRALDPQALLELFSINAVAPALVAKHFLPLTPRDRPSVFAALSARVGSISDNRLGGWYGYRASKAALNMMIATLAIEHRRTHPLGLCVALHPGTVETRLSAPFPQQPSSAGRLTPDAAAAALVEVMDGLGQEDTGGFFAWDGKPIPW